MTAGAGGSSRILLSEIKAIIDNPHDYMDIYVSQSNIGFWKVVMQGPPDSPYANRTFLLYIEIRPEFPRTPPSARFITPMLHPNITKIRSK
jgi:ubiquitin-protein ligase